MPSLDQRIQKQLTAQIATRWRQLLLVMAAGAAGLGLTNWLLVPGYPPFALVTHAVSAGVGVFAARLLRAEPFASRPVLFGLGMLVAGVVQRTVAGAATHDITSTAVLAVGVTLTIAAAVPWGVWPQLIAVVLAASAVAANGAAVGGTIAALGPSVGVVAAAFALSIVLAWQVERSQVELITENWRRGRSEAELARLNTELEQRVRARTAELEAVIENSPDAIWSVDRYRDVHVINGAARRRFARRYGYPYDPARRDGGIPPSMRDDIDALFARAFAGEHAEIERTLEGPDGIGHFHISVHPIVEGGTVVGATVFSRDVTARRRAEEQSRQHQADLAHVLRIGTMGEMAAGLAHEINQPLGAIANYALGAARRLRDGTAMAPAALLEVVEQIGAEALRAGDIIRRLRALLQKEEPCPQPVDLNEVARASARVVEGEARRLGVGLELQLATTLPPVLGDPIQLEQVLLNLLLNGIEASVAACEDARIVVRTAAENGDVEVSVSDRGVGLPSPPADVFAPFFTTKPRGLGMGLSISRSIVEMHGGRLEGQPNPDRGSTFRLTLPSDASHTPAQA